MLETDSPWCDVRPEHYGHKYLTAGSQFPTRAPEKWQEGHCVKRRTEPCHIGQVLDVVAGALCGGDGCSREEVGHACYENARRMFFPP